ncbi:putative porin [Arcicella rigui]|uniref:Porin n=1 Tax=Arcicella rigui TaxID=797020 RepID=A0ABU5QDI8_9BACT|nr:putative porin [Arcicella rigui]MEA5140632.1 putative porin [Arcicella rigui]
MNFKRYILTFFGLLISEVLLAQISSDFGTGNSTNNTFPKTNSTTTTAKKGSRRGGLDDSTKVIYGPTSTKYFLEEDVFNNRKKLYTIDTTLGEGHNFNFVQRNRNLYQDLGNMGTAIRPIFFKAPEQIGTMLGYDAYSLYSFKPNQVRYYNTRSPFSNLVYVTGGNEQDLLQFELSRNVDSLWNFSINLQRIVGNKQLVSSTSSSNKNAMGHWDFMVHTNYQTRNKKYQLLAYANLSDHNSNDEGGVLPQGRTYDVILQQSNNASILANAATRDKFYNLHLYHEYVGYKAFQVYQVLDFQTRKVQFRDPDYVANWTSGFYPIAYDTLGKASRYTTDATVTNKMKLDSLYNENSYSIFEHKSGIKGFYRGFNYRLHLRQRFFGFSNPLYNYSINKNENFLGVWLNQYFKDSTRAFAEVEYLLTGSDFKLNVEFQGKWLNIGGKAMSTSPTLVQQVMFNDGFRWDKNTSSFVTTSGISNNMQTYTAYASASPKFGNLVLRPSADITLINSYIYYDTLAFVKQASSDIGIFRAGMGLDWKKGRFSTTNQLYLTTTTGPDVIRIPKIFANSRLAFDLLYKKKLFIHTGLELHYKSNYYADGYMPAIQQFHLQDTQLIKGYVQADVFADMRINRVRLFVKFANVAQGILGNGYYAAPGFAGMGRTFGFGLQWLLFD